MSMSQKRQRSVSATPKGRRLLSTAQGSFEDGPLTYSQIAERTNISEKTVGRFFRGEGVDRPYAQAIIKFLGLSEQDVLSPDHLLVNDSIEKIASSDTADSESAKQLIEGLEAALNKLDQDQETNFQAMEWLKANRQALAQEAAETVLRTHFAHLSTDASIDQSEIEQFSRDIRKHLQVLYYCLEEGSWEVLEGAIQESLIPINREIVHYTEALSFIRDQKLSQYLSPKIAETVALLLNYLIHVLPLRF
jgi:transcriptional regulator with XRE-family HTH domain